MKKINQVLLATSLMALMLFSCGKKSNEDLIVGSWQFDHLDLIASNNGVQPAPEDVIRYKEEEGILRHMILTYNEDRTYKLEMRAKNISGTYKLENEGKNLSNITAMKNGGTVIENYEILNLNDDSLKLKSDKGGVLVYKRLKEKN
jgi:hypothetical protein